MNDCFGGMGVYAVVSAEDSNEDWRKKKAKYQQLRVWEEFEERQLNPLNSNAPAFLYSGIHSCSASAYSRDFNRLCSSSLFPSFEYVLHFYLQYFILGKVSSYINAMAFTRYASSSRYFSFSRCLCLRDIFNAHCIRCWGGRTAIEMWESGLRC